MANAPSMCVFSCLLGGVRVKSRLSGSKAMGMMVALLMFASFQLSLQSISYFEIWIIFQLEMRADETSSSREGPMFYLLQLGSLGLNWPFSAKSWDNDNKPCPIIQVHKSEDNHSSTGDLNTSYAQELQVHSQPKVSTGLVRANWKWPREREEGKLVWNKS